MSLVAGLEAAEGEVSGIGNNFVDSHVMIARNAVVSLEHNAPGCNGRVSHLVLTGLALCPLAGCRCRHLPRRTATVAFVATANKHQKIVLK